MPHTIPAQPKQRCQVCLLHIKHTFAVALNNSVYPFWSSALKHPSSLYGGYGWRFLTDQGI